ncbi:MAG: hypothetical protein KDK76_06270 [Chlamydiia bacterium]|nr:hypothetical protein [Chlamydiia bacterium]
MVQSLGVSQNWRSRFNPIEAASYPKDRSDADRVKDQDANEGKNQVLNHDRYIFPTKSWEGIFRGGNFFLGHWDYSLNKIQNVGIKLLRMLCIFGTRR